MAINLRGCECESSAFESESKSSKCGLEYYITENEMKKTVNLPPFNA